MKKKPTIGTIDTLWAKYIKKRAGDQCEYCGKQEGLNSHHIFSRSNRSTRWDVNNGVCLCVSHHVFGNFSAHKAPVEFTEWLKETRGEEWYKELRRAAQSVIQQDFEQIKKDLQEKLV